MIWLGMKFLKARSANPLDAIHSRDFTVIRAALTTVEVATEATMVLRTHHVENPIQTLRLNIENADRQ